MVFGWFRLGISWRGDLSLARYLLGLPLGHEDVGGAEVERAINGGLAGKFYWYLFQVNFLWPLINLLPIYPLDGGQVAMTLLQRFDRRHGARRTHILSMVTAGILAAFALNRMTSSEDGQSAFYLVIFFGLFAFINFQHLQSYHRKYIESGPDDADWWRR